MPKGRTSRPLALIDRSLDIVLWLLGKSAVRPCQPRSALPAWCGLQCVIRVLGGTPLSVEFIGMVHHRRESEIHPAGPEIMDLPFVRELARAHDQGGFDRVLVGYYGHAPDGFLMGQFIAAQTERLGVLIAHRPGFVAPPLAARKFATLDHLTGGRAAMHVVSGAMTRNSIVTAIGSTRTDAIAAPMSMSGC